MNDAPEVPAFFGWFDHFGASIKTAALRTGLETEKGDTYTYAQWQGFLAHAGFANVARVGSLIRAEAT